MIFPRDFVKDSAKNGLYDSETNNLE